MRSRGFRIAIGLAGLAALLAVAAWLHRTGTASFPAIPGPGELGIEEAVVPAAPPAAAPASAPPLPVRREDGAPAPEKTPQAGPTARPLHEDLLQGRDAMPPPDRTGPSDPGAPDEARTWVNLGRNFLANSRPQEGKAALRRAYSLARTPEARAGVRQVWIRHGLPREELDPARLPTRAGGRAVRPAEGPRPSRP